MGEFSFETQVVARLARANRLRVGLNSAIQADGRAVRCLGHPTPDRPCLEANRTKDLAPRLLLLANPSDKIGALDLLLGVQGIRSPRDSAVVLGAGCFFKRKKGEQIRQLLGCHLAFDSLRHQ